MSICDAMPATPFSVNAIVLKFVYYTAAISMRIFIITVYLNISISISLPMIQFMCFKSDLCVVSF